jgi:hypothetical protein
MPTPDPHTSAMGRAILDASTRESPPPAPGATWTPEQIRRELLAEADRLEAIALQMSFHVDGAGPAWADSRHELCGGADWCRRRAQLIQDSMP